MSNETNGMKAWKGFCASFNFIGGLSGLLAIGLLVWKGGELKRQVDVNTVRISNIEAGGSPGLRAHEARDSAEQTEQDRRIADLERAFVSVNEVRVQVGQLNVKVDALKEQAAAVAVQLKELAKAK